jgi:exonuclease SbcD
LPTSSNSRSDRGELTLLAIGDVHLGTRPGSLPEDLDGLGVDPRSLTPEAALSITVDRAIERDVDAVLFAGDVVESTNARFEALRPLETAVRRLREADIPVLAVVGNHDVEALPRLARMIEGLELIGEGGRWQTRLVEKPGGAAVEILGWCFPERRVRNSPIAQLLRNPVAPSRPGIPRIGLLHADLDASGGDYAPITSGELVEAGLDAWLLGHIHKPSLSDGKRSDGSGPHGYLGSLVGLDPGELGPHGPWLVSVTAGGDVVTRQLPLAPLRWERFDLLVGEDEGPEDVGDRLLGEAERFANEIHEKGSIPKALGLRPHLIGRTRCYDALRRHAHDGRWKGLTRWVGDTLIFIDKVIDDLELAHDLRELARGDDPPALLARKLLVLERSGEERKTLIEATRGALQSLASETRWSALDAARGAQDPLSDDALAALLTKSGRAALSELLSQRDADAGVES